MCSLCLSRFVFSSRLPGTSGACFANGQYFGKVVCPAAAHAKSLAAQVSEVSIVDAVLPVPQNSAAVASGSMLALAVAAVMALFA